MTDHTQTMLNRMAKVQIEASVGRFVRGQCQREVAKFWTDTKMTITKLARIDARSGVSLSAIAAHAGPWTVRPGDGMLSAIGMAVNEQITAVRAMSEADGATVH